MDIYNLLVYKGSVALLRIFFGCIPEEATADGFLDSHCGFATRYHIQFMSEEKTAWWIFLTITQDVNEMTRSTTYHDSIIPVHDAQHLFADVLRSAKGASLDEVLVTPGVRELVVLP